MDNAKPDDGPFPGCIVDGHAGIYAYVYVIDYAKEYGYVPTYDYPQDPTTSLDSDIDYLVEESDRAIEWLNAMVAKDGYLFGWNDGEVFYNHVNWWEDEA